MSSVKNYRGRIGRKPPSYVFSDEVGFGDVPWRWAENITTSILSYGQARVSDTGLARCLHGCKITAKAVVCSW